MTKKTHGDFYSYDIDYVHDASIGGTMTAPNYEGSGIYTCVYSQIFRWLREKGRARAIFDTAKDNTAVQEVQAKLGSNIWCKIHHLRLLYLINFKWSEYHKESS